MNAKHRITTAIAAAIVLTGALLAAPAPAHAGSVKATVRWSGGSVRIGDGGARVRIGRAPQRYQGRYQKAHHITRKDMAMARRLSWYAGVPKGDMLEWRRNGHGWVSIGRWLGVPRSVLRASGDADRWRRFLRNAGYGDTYEREREGRKPRAWCGTRSYGGRTPR